MISEVVSGPGPQFHTRIGCNMSSTTAMRLSRMEQQNLTRKEMQWNTLRRRHGGRVRGRALFARPDRHFTRLRSLRVGWGLGGGDACSQRIFPMYELMRFLRQ